MTTTARLVATLPLLAFGLGLTATLAANAGTPLPSEPGGPEILVAVPTAPPPVPSGLRSASAARASGVAWLKAAQLADGGWGAGAFGQAAGVQSDVATTSMAVLALARDGGVKGPHARSIDRGLSFVIAAVMESPRDSARVRTPEGTQPQYKLGPMVDTHMAALVLSELAGQLPPARDAEVQIALDRVVGKVQLAQNADGSFEGSGWAPVLSSSVAAMSLVQAQEKGVDIAPEVLARADGYQDQQFDRSTGAFDASAGAGVELYSMAYNLRADADKKKRGVAGAGQAEAAARSAVTGSRADQVINGFGSVGGEEMLSYMMISDTLAETGGEDWRSWDGRISDWLTSIQNADGSWAGHHCITSQTFTTAVALMTLGAGDHAGQPQVGRVDRRPDEGQVFGSPSFGLVR